MRHTWVGSVSLRTLASWNVNFLPLILFFFLEQYSARNSWNSLWKEKVELSDNSRLSCLRFHFFLAVEKDWVREYGE